MSLLSNNVRRLRVRNKTVKRNARCYLFGVPSKVRYTFGAGTRIRCGWAVELARAKQELTRGEILNHGGKLGRIRAEITSRSRQGDREIDHEVLPLGVGRTDSRRGFCGDRVDTQANECYTR